MSFLWMFSRFYLSISEGYLCVLGAVLFLFILFGVPWILRFLVYAFPQILDSFIHYFLNFFPTPPPHLPLPYDSLDSLQYATCIYMLTMYSSSVQFSSVAQSCLTLCDPMNCSTPGLPVHHQLQEFTQTHVHWVGDAIQPSHPLSSPSPPAPNPSQHQSLFQWVNSSHEVAKVLEFQL